MKNLLKYVSTAPVLLTVWLCLTSTFILLINYYFPDNLTVPVL